MEVQHATAGVWSPWAQESEPEPPEPPPSLQDILEARAWAQTGWKQPLYSGYVVGSESYIVSYSPHGDYPKHDYQLSVIIS